MSPGRANEGMREIVRSRPLVKVDPPDLVREREALVLAAAEKEAELGLQL